jgi:dipeptidyl aminopeptidase/acylaminoacyl peptidase
VRKISLLTLLLILIVSLGVTAEEGKILKPEDTDKFTYVGSPEVSPDGKWILYSISKYCEEKETRVSNLFLRPMAGGEPMRLTGGYGGESGYTWHPGSEKVAFSARRNGKSSQIYVININGGEAMEVTTIETGASSPQWSPDGKKISFYSSVGSKYSDEEKEFFGDVRYAKHLRYYHLGPGWDDGSRRRIFVVDLETGETKQLTDGACADEGDHSMVWSPDSKEIAFVSNREKEWWNTIDTNIFIVSLETGEIRQFNDNPGPDHSPNYSPDGKWLAWRASYEYNYESENYKVVVAPAAGGDFKALTEKLDRNINWFDWNNASSRIYFTAASHGSRNLQYVDVAEPEVFVDVTTGVNSLRGINILDEKTFVFSNSNGEMPSEIFKMKDGEMHQLTSDASESWEPYDISPTKEIWITNSDGIKVQGWLIKPVGYKDGDTYPLILQIHGGPHGMYGPRLSTTYQMYAQNGFGVLYTNPRGSEGYGEEFKAVIQEDWNTAPFTDIMEFVDYVIANEGADPDKLGVTGGSYGGYLTNYVIGNTDRFSAAISVAGLSNMVSFYGTTDEQFFPEKEMKGSPWENRDAYIFNSPLWHAEKFTTPTMVVHGEDDWRVRPEQGRQLFTALQKMGVPSVYVEFPGEQHGVRGFKHRITLSKLTMDWWKHWLMGEDQGMATYLTPTKFEYQGK